MTTQSEKTQVRQPELLAQWLLSSAHDLGISRLADITGLDRLGIPCHAAIVPSGTDIISSYSGKGVDAETSIVSAVMEAVERNASKWDMSRVEVASCDELTSSGRLHVDPNEFTEPLAAGFTPSSPICWTRSSDVATGDDVLVPSDIVFAGERPKGLPTPAFRLVTSNGLAAGFTIDQAIMHGIREVIERDIVSCCELIAIGFDAGLLEAMARAFGMSLVNHTQGFQCRTPVGRRVRLESLPPKLKELVGRFTVLGISIAIRALPNHFGLPAFGACAIEELSSNNWLAGAGYGVHADPETALQGAITEIAQGRATSLQGAREDYHGHHLKSRLSGPPRSDWLLDEEAPWIDYRTAVEAMVQDGATHSLDYYCGRARGAGLGRVLAVPFTHLRVPAVRILIPGAETVHPTEGHARLGRRAERLRNTDAKTLIEPCQTPA